MAHKKGMRAAGESIGFLVILAGILVALNVFGAFAFARVDATKANLYSLSAGSGAVAKNLDDRMEVIAYFTEDLPPPFNATERYVRDLLREYERASDGNIELKLVHPDTDEEKRRAREDGAELVQHRAIENDSIQVVEGFRSIVIKHLGDKKVITVGRDTKGLEYEITTAMKELKGDSQPVGVVSGHGGPTLGEGLSTLKSALPTYELKEVSLDGGIDPELAALLIIEPTEPFSEEELKRIDQYMMKGGTLGIYGGGAKVTLPTQQNPGPLTGETVDTQLNRLLGKWGVRIQQNVLADAQCGRVPMQGRLPIPVAYPPMPVLNFDEAQQEHPVLFRISTAQLPFTSSLAVEDLADDQVRVQVLGKTSEQSWTMTGSDISLQPRDPREWQPRREGPLPVLAAIEGKLPSAFAGDAAMSTPDGDDGGSSSTRAEKEARVFVAGSGMFVRDELLPREDRQGRRRMTGSLALALNSIDWLAQDSDLIAIRAKDVEDPTLQVPESVGEAEQRAVEAAEKAQTARSQAEAAEAQHEQEEALDELQQAKAAWEQKKQLYRWGNSLGIPALFALFGVVRWRMRVSKKQNIKL